MDDVSWHAYSYVKLRGVMSSIVSKDFVIKASVMAPSCSHIQARNSTVMTWLADSKWKNGASQYLTSLRIITVADGIYEFSYGSRAKTNVIMDETFIPYGVTFSYGKEFEQVGRYYLHTFGFSSYCQISYNGVTSGWYVSSCKQDTDVGSPTTSLSSNGVLSWEVGTGGDDVSVQAGVDVLRLRQGMTEGPKGPFSFPDRPEGSLGAFPRPDVFPSVRRLSGPQRGPRLT